MTCVARGLRNMMPDTEQQAVADRLCGRGIASLSLCVDSWREAAQLIGCALLG